MKLIGVLEGLLFINGEDGISFEKAKNILEIEDDELENLFNELSKTYDDSSRGLRLVKYGDSYKLTTKEEHKEYYKKLVDIVDDSILSQACLETLAIIAYNGPVTRITVDEIRGINSSHIIRKLMSKNLIEDIGKADLPGRPHLYQITRDFLDYFGISSTDELPVIEEIQSENEEQNLFESKYKEIN